jgi:hypothetical protein
VDESDVRSGYDADELQVLDEFLEHGRAVRAERLRARAAGEQPDFVPLVRSWGGVTLAYRKRMADSPAYRLNHEEIIKALEEGIWFAENLDPREIIVDEADHALTLVVKGPNGPVRLPARTVLVAAGTSPNVTYEKEQPGTFQLDSKRRFFQGFRAEGSGAAVSLHPTRPAFSPPTTSGRLGVVLRRQPPDAPGTSSRRWRQPGTAIRRSWRALASDLPARSSDAGAA